MIGSTGYHIIGNKQKTECVFKDKQSYNLIHLPIATEQWDGSYYALTNMKMNSLLTVDAQLFMTQEGAINNVSAFRRVAGGN